MGYAQLVIGPVGSGKSTYCYNLQQHYESICCSVHIVNLDLASENFKYSVATDIREFMSLEDVTEELNLGLNGGLIHCMEHLEENLEDCLDDDSSPKNSSILTHECKWHFI